MSRLRVKSGTKHIREASNQLFGREEAKTEPELIAMTPTPPIFDGVHRFAYDTRGQCHFPPAKAGGKRTPSSESS